MLSVAVLISGTGSNLRALLEAASDPGFPARIVVVGADREAEGFAHAEDFGIPTFMVPFAQFDSREEWGGGRGAGRGVVGAARGVGWGGGGGGAIASRLRRCVVVRSATIRTVRASGT